METTVAATVALQGGLRLEEEGDAQRRAMVNAIMGAQLSLGLSNPTHQAQQPSYVETRSMEPNRQSNIAYHHLQG
ncbi:unnamed protein product [Linum trigynum]|uniref:Uncharacterized protein n=1 Tax=Linum trigynum TaxID=586398 RepID=A0AAV2E0C1_9ROSI